MATRKGERSNQEKKKIRTKVKINIQRRTQLAGPSFPMAIATCDDKIRRKLTWKDKLQAFR